MVAKHSMKVNGKWYRAGGKIPHNEPREKESRQYTKTEINRMSKTELQELASNTGVEGVYNMTVAELREYLISLFGL